MGSWIHHVEFASESTSVRPQPQESPRNSGYDAFVKPKKDQQLLLLNFCSKKTWIQVVIFRVRIYYCAKRKKKQGLRQRHTSKNLPGVQAVFHYSNHRSVLTHMIASYWVCGALQWSLMTKIEDRDSPSVAICGLCMFVLRLMHWFLF